jgi:hypothetical protein
LCGCPGLGSGFGCWQQQQSKSWIYMTMTSLSAK